jgi:hypothetical protein
MYHGATCRRVEAGFENFREKGIARQIDTPAHLDDRAKPANYLTLSPADRAAKNTPSPTLAPKRLASRKPKFSRWV